MNDMTGQKVLLIYYYELLLYYREVKLASLNKFSDVVSIAIQLWDIDFA